MKPISTSICSGIIEEHHRTKQIVEAQETEIVAAGFPCIDVSRAGLRRGLDGQVAAHRGLLSGSPCMHEGLRIWSSILLHLPGRLKAWPNVTSPMVDAQSTSLVRHVFRLLETALKDNRGIPWVLLENVSPMLPSSLCNIYETFISLDKGASNPIASFMSH